MTFLTILGVMEILCSFRLVLKGKSRLDFVLSDIKDNTSSPLNRRGTAHLPLLRTLLALCQKSKESSSVK